MNFTSILMSVLSLFGFSSEEPCHSLQTPTLIGCIFLTIQASKLFAFLLTPLRSAEPSIITQFLKNCQTFRRNLFRPLLTHTPDPQATQTSTPQHSPSASKPEQPAVFSGAFDYDTVLNPITLKACFFYRFCWLRLEALQQRPSSAEPASIGHF